MPDRIFLDTNVIIYLYSATEANKREKLCRALDNAYRVTSLQALNEASNVWFKKYSWRGEVIGKHLDNISVICHEVLPITRGTINAALLLKDKYGYSYFDCLMLASAVEGGCNVIFTEDMQHGQVVNETLKIVNPFL